MPSLYESSGGGIALPINARKRYWMGSVHWNGPGLAVAEAEVANSRAR